MKAPHDKDRDLLNLTEAELEANLQPRGCPQRPRPNEQQALDFLLAGEGAVLEALRAQLADARVSIRHLSNAGFFVDFESPPAQLTLPGKPSFRLHDVYAEIRGLQYGMGLILFVKDGLADQLEGFPYAEELPADWEIESMTYSDRACSTDPPITRPADAPHVGPGPSHPR